MMTSKISILVFCFILVGGNCWAAAVDGDSYWSFDSGHSLFVFKQNKELAQDPCHFIMDCANKGKLERLVWALSTQRESPAFWDKLSKDRGGVTLLSAAVHGSVWYLGQHAACVRFLLQHKADPNANASRSVLDNAPLLSCAVKYGVVEVVKALLEGGADITLLDDKKLSVFSYLNKIEHCLVHVHNLITKQAAETVKEEMTKLLLRHCADVLFKAIDDENAYYFEQVCKFVWSVFETGGGSWWKEIKMVRNDCGMNVVEYGLERQFLEKHGEDDSFCYYTTKNGRSFMNF